MLQPEKEKGRRWVASAQKTLLSFSLAKYPRATEAAWPDRSHRHCSPLFQRQGTFAHTRCAREDLSFAGAGHIFCGDI
jgi:hypothetical protein